MSNVSSNFLLTYDSNLELHSDSSDFEGTQSPVITDKKGKHKFHMKKLYPMRNRHLQTCNSHDYIVTEDKAKVWETQKTTVNQYGETVDETKMRKSHTNRKYKTLETGDQIATIKSKCSLIRHKVLPCLSSMFRRSSNNVKQMSIIKENQAENVNIDNGCQASVNCEHKIRKFNRRQPCYAVQPVYAIEGNIHNRLSPVQHIKIVREPSPPRETFGYENNSNMSNSLTSSTEGHRTRKHNKKKMLKRNKTRLDAYNCQTYGESDPKSDIVQQYPSASISSSPYQIRSPHPECSQLTSGSISNDIPSTSSGFWDYLFNKINMKYQGNLSRLCKCNTTIAGYTHCCPPTCEKNVNPQYMNQPNMCPQPQHAYYNPNPPKQDSCCCVYPPQAPVPPAPDIKIQNKPSPHTPPNKSKADDKVICKCYSNKKGASQPSSPGAAGVKRSTSPLGTPDAPRPCQIPHDEITNNLIQKYNGEILCIHNPPCVLINGCLNMPSKDEPAMNTYVATNVNSTKSGFQQAQISKRQKSAQYSLPTMDKQHGHILDESCQYLCPTKENYFENDKLNESCQYQIPERLKEQIMVADDSCQYRLENDVRKKNISINESCQYRISTIEIPKPQDTTHDSCQCQVPPCQKSKHKIATNEKCRYRGSPFEIQKQQVTTNQSGQQRMQQHGTKTNENCKSPLSPFAIPKQQTSQRYKLSAFETQKQPITTNESCQYWVSHTETQKPYVAANESIQYHESPDETPKQQQIADTVTDSSSKESEPVVELKPVKLKKEKLIQSICSHYPPCEVVRTCRKTKYDPKLQNSCVHVPMCQKVPLCLMEVKEQHQASCQHKPKCAEVPVCTRNYIILTAKEEAATQVRPKNKMVCRHEPPCIMIPKCLAQVCDSCIPCDAIPDCVHQPMCEMIPACCRKSAKEMVSVRLQFPNQCSIA
uniref:Uncharacterized protein n=1 Tax=Heliothis virescens TaxID=7102 RepID=A0A2A4JU74_HELVI